MDADEKPVVAVSRCLEFDACRWNGLMISSETVKKLKPHVLFVPVCPEAGAGLGVPRKPIRLIGTDGRLVLVQSETGLEVTGAVASYIDDFTGRLGAVDGFILKDRSPTCGIKDVKVYPSAGKVAAVSNRGTGFLARAVLERFSGAAIENEGRLGNLLFREHFLSKLFTLFRFRCAKKKLSMSSLVGFHTEHKYLFMAYNQQALRLMGRITANPGRNTPALVFEEYGAVLSRALARPPRVSSNINVLMHCLGYFSEKITRPEKAFFLGTVEKYRKGTIPLAVCAAVLSSWIARYDEAYLRRQAFFSPYPDDLADSSDTGKGRPRES